MADLGLTADTTDEDKLDALRRSIAAGLFPQQQAAFQPPTPPPPGGIAPAPPPPAPQQTLGAMTAPQQPAQAPPPQDAQAAPQTLGAMTMGPMQKSYQDKLANAPAAPTGIKGFLLNLASIYPLGRAIEQAIPGSRANYEANIPKFKAAADQETAAQNTNLAQQKGVAEVADAQSQTTQREALARKADADANKASQAPAAKLQRAIIDNPEKPGEPLAVDFNPQNGAYVNPTTGEAIAGAKPWQKPAGVPAGDDFEKFYKAYLTDNHFPDTAHNRLLAKTQYAAASQAPEKDPRQLMVVANPDGSSRVIEAKPGMTIPKGAQTVSESGKSQTPTADEQRRADLAENMNENLSQLESILTKRPELFGPVAGRLTQLRGTIGSNDTDIGALETIKHQLGMAQLGAHSMRSAQGVEKAADSILNSFHNGPDAVKAAIAAARNSLSTFSGDVARKGGDTGPTKATKAAPQGKPGDPLGIF